MKKIDHNNIGLAAFFKQDYVNEKEEFKCLYEDYLPDYFKEMPREIKQRRNLIIYLTSAQIVASVFGMFYIIFRRSFIYLIINTLTVLLAFCGLYGCINMHLIALLIHCLFTTSITGGFFIYQLFDFFLVDDTSYGNNTRINDNYILFIFSLPYLFDLIVGLSNYFFIGMVSEFNSAKNRLLRNDIELLTKNISSEVINEHLNKNQKICVICLENPRDTVIQPCGHVLACEDCVSSLLERINIISSATCPVCRKKIDSYGKFYMA
jgi:hypothetical protein